MLYLKIKKTFSSLHFVISIHDLDQIKDRLTLDYQHQKGLSTYMYKYSVRYKYDRKLFMSYMKIQEVIYEKLHSTIHHAREEYKTSSSLTTV